MLCLFEDGNLAGRRSVRRQSLFYDLYPFREDAHIVTFANVHEIYMGNTNESANQRIVKWRLRFADSLIRRFVVSAIRCSVFLRCRLAGKGGGFFRLLRLFKEQPDGAAPVK